MVDATIKERVIIHNEGIAGPYIMVNNEQLESITKILKNNNVQYWVDEDAISIDQKPAVAVINLGHNSDISTIQDLLDAN